MVENLLASGLGSEFELDIISNLSYSGTQENRQKFLEKILPQIKQIVKDTQEEVYASAGVPALVIVP